MEYPYEKDWWETKDHKKLKYVIWKLHILKIQLNIYKDMKIFMMSIMELLMIGTVMIMKIIHI